MGKTKQSNVSFNKTHFMTTLGRTYSNSHQESYKSIHDDIIKYKSNTNFFLKQHNMQANLDNAKINIKDIKEIPPKDFYLTDMKNVPNPLVDRRLLPVL